MTESYSVQASISGLVQGVYFRACTRDQAKSLGLYGTVCNLSDGSVEAVITGKRCAVEQLIDWLHQGSPGAKVEQVIWKEISEPKNLRGGFNITHQ